MDIKKITITTGGTGGHVIPGIALAQALIKKGIEVNWLGSKSGIESTLVAKAGIDINYINAYRVKNQNVFKKILALVCFMPSIFAARSILKKNKPDLIISMGGFVAVTGSLAARTLGIPIIIHEQNAVMGMANRTLSHLASKVITAFPDTHDHKKLIQLGNPLRNNLLQLTPPQTRYEQRQGKIRLLILGGSGGAAQFNKIITSVLADIRKDLRPQIWHQTGKEKLQTITDLYAEKGVKAQIDGFIDDIGAAYAWADLVISRSGAISVSEIAAAGIAAILVPYPHAANKHQHANARHITSTDGAIIIEQAELAAKLPAIITKWSAAESLNELDNKRHKLSDMAQKVYQCPIYCNADKIATECLAG
jgi:UDP-N-acetylglucosamine--N-acetylmuramyl-(pentapeptide) pyrophosphoryl-undecaprenol N-acetylglucosamine transferase